METGLDCEQTGHTIDRLLTSFAVEDYVGVPPVHGVGLRDGGGDVGRESLGDSGAYWLWRPVQKCRRFRA